MEFNKPVNNPMLVGTIQLLHAEDTPEHREMFLEELKKSSLLAPAVMDPPPLEDENGNMLVQVGSKAQFPALMTPDGKKFLMGFTDAVEYQKWVEKNSKHPTFALTLGDYANMLFRKDIQNVETAPVGVVINPFGVNLVLPKELIATMIANWGR